MTEQFIPELYKTLAAAIRAVVNDDQHWIGKANHTENACDWTDLEQFLSWFDVAIHHDTDRTP